MHNQPSHQVRRMWLLLAPLVTLIAGSRAVAAADDCEAARCAVQAAIAQNCPCDAATNHGRYVSCVAHQVKGLAVDGVVPLTCKGKVTRCAARSTCGKAGTVTCIRPVLGTCNVAAGTCVENPALLCTADTNCVLGTKCAIKHDAGLCAAAGGTVGTTSTCCSNCSVAPY